MTETSSQVFQSVRVRYFVLAWLLMIFYLPGAEIVFRAIDIDAPWYWWDLAYIYYAQLMLAAVLILTILFPIRLPVRGLIGTAPTISELRSGILLSAFLFLFAWAAAYVLFLPLSYWVPAFVDAWYIGVPDLIYFDYGEYPILPNFLNLFSLCVAAPILEEFAFRGVILHRWSHKFGLRSAVLWSSLLFGIVHPDPLGAFAFGIGMCVLYLRTQSLLLPIICHGVYNFVVWLVEIGFIFKDGPEHEYTLSQFQDEWLGGLVAAVLVVAWAAWFIRTQKQDRPWNLPEI